jgi:anti-sigma factor RsiW
MDHGYIDANALADRYVRRTLPAGERADFEAHLVDCQECSDRVLLAEMFLLRNTGPTPVRVAVAPREASPRDTASTTPQPAPPQLCPPVSGLARYIAQWRPWQVALLLAIAGVLLLFVPTAYFLKELHRLRGN